MGIENISASLMGFKRNGWTTARLDRNSFNANIGTRRRFEQLVGRFAPLGVDISFAQDYAVINTYNVSFAQHAVRHVSDRTVTNNLDVASAWSTNMPVTETSLLRVDSTADFIRDFAQTMHFMDSMTISGISNRLYSQHNHGAVLTVSQSLDIVQSAFRDVSQTMYVNATTPHQYLWAYTDRFLQTPMFSSQFLVTTDTVPFLQMVLHGTMQMFSPYVNFSFSTDADILRLIDFNVYPAFLFTYAPSYLLAQTNSAHMFSTEFALHQDLLRHVYHTVNDVLRHTAGANWIDREVLAPGVVVNTYDNGAQVIINYTHSEVTALGLTIPPLSAKVRGVYTGVTGE